ncbi:nucleotidyl transferase AbiEii/AbiGii toxin family protein [Acidobacteriota bacterium]
MKERLKDIVGAQDNKLYARCLAREYCQARILQILQDMGVFRAWVFHGGTALRFLYGIPRFSEDLDFTLRPEIPGSNFRDVIKKIQTSLEAEAYEVYLKIRDDTPVNSAFIRLPGLLWELGLSPHRAEVFSIKVEVDVNPPAGGIFETTVVRRHVLLNLCHHDKASLLAGKLHAILTRGFLKGRDIYDLVWYLSDRSWPAPNLVLLNNALVQTGWAGKAVTPESWPLLVAQRLGEAEWRRALEDVRPFLERPEEIALLARENVLGLLLEYGAD